jgi:hypothetical protein
VMTWSVMISASPQVQTSVMLVSHARDNVLNPRSRPGDRTTRGKERMSHAARRSRNTDHSHD